MRTVSVIARELGEQQDRLVEVGANLKDAQEKAAQAQTALDLAVRDVYLGNLPKEKEEKARATCTEITVQIDRLQRIIPMLTGKVKELEEELKGLRWGEALNRASEVEGELAILVEQICDGYEELHGIGEQLRKVISGALEDFRLLGRPVPNPQELVNSRRREREGQLGRRLVVY